jgi:hypothetical protein
MSSKQEQEQEPTGPRLMGERGIARDHMDLIKTAVDGSPNKVAVVGVRMADGRQGFSAFDFKNAEPFDHVLIVYYDSNKQDYVVGEMMPGDKPGSESDYGRLFGSSSTPSTLEEVAGQWHKFVAVPVTLTPEQDALLRSSAEKNLSAGNTYSFLSEQGNTCASGVRKVLLDAKVWDWSEQGFWVQLEKAGLNIVQPGTIVEWAAQRGGVIYDSHGYLRSHSPDVSEDGPAMDTQEHRSGESAATAEKDTYVNFKTMLQDGWDNFRETFPDAADKLAELLLQLAGQEPSFMGAAADVKFGIPDIVLSKTVAAEALQGLWDDFSEAFPEAAEALAEHLVKTYGEPGPFGSYSFQFKAGIPMMVDKLAQPAPDGQAGSSSNEPASVHEEAANASADDGAHIGDLSVMAKAELGSHPALDNQPAPHLATSDPVQDDRFSFSMFTKQGVAQGEVAKEVMPAGQLSPQDSGSGMPAGESVHVDVGSEDVGNAAPTKDPVVHHGDLAP